MTDRPPQESGDFVDQEGPGSDPGAAYERTQGAQPEPSTDDEPGPDVGDVYRSGG